MKILFVTTVLGTMNFFIDHFRMLKEYGYDVEIASKIGRDISEDIIEMKIPLHNISFSRSVFSKNNIKAFSEIKGLIAESDYDIIHTHTPIASAIVRMACKTAGRKDIKVYYTAHGFHFYNGAPLMNWLLFYPVERIMSRYTDKLITINTEDYERAKSFTLANDGELCYVHGVGVDINKFRSSTGDKGKIRCNLGVMPNDKVIVSVGELNDNKNHETIIRALAKVNYSDYKYFICGSGNKKEYLEDLVKELKLEEKVFLLGFRTDIPEILSIADLFVFPSKREGLPVSVMEAMSNNIPIICSDIRGNNDLIKDGFNGYLVEGQNIELYAKYIDRLFGNSDLSKKLGKNSDKILPAYSIENVKREMAEIYGIRG